MWETGSMSEGACNYGMLERKLVLQWINQIELHRRVHIIIYTTCSILKLYKKLLPISNEKLCQCRIETHVSEKCLVYDAVIYSIKLYAFYLPEEGHIENTAKFRRHLKTYLYNCQFLGVYQFDDNWNCLLTPRSINHFVLMCLWVWRLRIQSQQQLYNNYYYYTTWLHILVALLYQLCDKHVYYSYLHSIRYLTISVLSSRTLSHQEYHS